MSTMKETLVFSPKPTVDDKTSTPVLSDPISEKIITIKNFYKNSEIFITGGTGFLGKTLIEKLLRSCDELQHIYILMRPKRGLTSEQRYKEFIKNPIFDRLQKENPEQLDKIICVAGDIKQELLILDDVLRDKILNNVDIVFHVAATVRFNESLRDAVDQNMMGTQRVLNLCCQMKRIKSFVYVSTAYSNPNRFVVGEMVYPTHPIDKSTLINCLNSFRGDEIDLIADRIQGKHPNTYSLTKSMAESIVADYITKFPICIVRPSVVTAAISEPIPGWVDGVSGSTRLIIEVLCGTPKSILGDEKLIVDLIPVDIVIKTMIAAAWNSTNILSNNIQVYNCTSGTLNPIKWKKFNLLIQKYACKNPSKYVTLYPGFKFRTNQVAHKFYEIFYHFLPALVLDIIMRAQGKKPTMMKNLQVFKIFLKSCYFFTTNEFQFENKNLAQLINNVRMTNDSEDFDFTMAWDWTSYVETYTMGVRKYVLKDDLVSMESARKKIKRILWTTRIFQMTIFIISYLFIVKPLFNYLL